MKSKKTRFAYREELDLICKLKIIAKKQDKKVNVILDEICDEIIKEYEFYNGEIDLMEEIYLEDYF